MPTHWALALHFASQTWQVAYSVGGVLFDGVDVAMLVLAVSLALRGLPAGAPPLSRIPHLRLWVVLTCLLTAAYAVSPTGQASMTDPIRIAYQSYRYAVRSVILYPLCYLIITTGRRFDAMVTAIVLVATAFSLMSWKQGYSGEWGTGPFSTKNGLAAALAAPIVLMATDLLRGRFTWFNVISVVVLLRGALFASSRGAFAGMAVGVAVAWLFLLRGRVRTHVAVGVVMGISALVVGVAVRPDLLERPTIARLLSTVDLQQNTLVWRWFDRWPYFFERVFERPWLGWGEAVDLSLGARVNTPHNGYLSTAVTHGLPVLGMYLVFFALTFRNVWAAARRSIDRADRVRAAQIGGVLACILTHNLIDAVVALPFVAGEVWLCAAFAARLRVGEAVRARGVVVMERSAVEQPGTLHVTRGNA
jgi:O-antigen ligase